MVLIDMSNEVMVNITYVLIIKCHMVSTYRAVLCYICPYNMNGTIVIQHWIFLATIKCFNIFLDIILYIFVYFQDINIFGYCRVFLIILCMYLYTYVLVPCILYMYLQD